MHAKLFNLVPVFRWRSLGTRVELFVTLCNWHDRHRTCKDPLFLVSSDSLICHCIHAILNLKYVFTAELFDGEKKDIEIQPGFEPGSSECRSDALTTGF